MIKSKHFGIAQKLDYGFDNEFYHHSTKDDLVFRSILNEYANQRNWLSFITTISKEFKLIQKQESNKIIILQFQIEQIEDLARALFNCEPSRYIKDERYRYDQDKVCKRASQLDLEIAEWIIELQRKIIQIIQNPNLPKNTVKIRLEPKLNKSPINLSLFKVYFLPDLDDKAILPQIEPIKRGWKFWLR